MYHEEIAQLTARIVEAERPEKIILFGSYASGTATESSDIDLLVISRSTLPRREREVRLTRQLFGSGVPYDLLVFTPEEVEERLRRNGPFIREILSTGQVVYQRRPEEAAEAMTAASHLRDFVLAQVRMR